MSSSTRPASPRRPSGSRPLVRRLFSTDSTTSAEGDGKTPPRSSSPAPSIGKMSIREPQAAGHPASSSLLERRAKKKPSVSFVGISSPLAASSTPALLGDIREIAESPTTILDDPMSRVLTSSPPPLASPKVRWQQVRQHMLPSTSSTASTGSLPITPTPSFTSFSQIGVPTGTASATPGPKPSRFAARLGFRQVVETAREVSDDISAKFSDEIQKACWGARFDTKTGRQDREPTTSSLASTFHLPTLSSANLTSTPNASTSSLPLTAQPKSVIRRLGSTSSFHILAHSAQLSALQNLISNKAANSSLRFPTSSVLPHEKEVLSVLLMSFLSSDLSQSTDDDRRVSLDIFETIFRTWRPLTVDVAMERCVWCCKAASIAPYAFKLRIVELLRMILVSTNGIIVTPIALKTIVPAIILIAKNDTNDTKDTDMKTIHDLLNIILSGKSGHLDLEDLTQKYKAAAEFTDDEDELRRVVVLEALMRCLELGSIPVQVWVLDNIIERYWPVKTSPSLTPLQCKMHAAKLDVFLRSTCQLLRALDASEDAASMIFSLVRSRVLPELDSMPEDISFSLRCLLTRLLMNLLTVANTEQSAVVALSRSWIEGQSRSHHECFQQEVKHMLHNEDWTHLLLICTNLISVLHGQAQKTLVSWLLPALHERMLSDPPPYPCVELSNLLEIICRSFPQLFFKPLFTCAASTKEVYVAHHLSILAVLARYTSGFWTRDAEMISVALMSDPKVDALPISILNPRPQALARLGQTVILFEVLFHIRKVRMERSEAAAHAFAKFLTGLEVRLAILIAAKEQRVCLPISQRLGLAGIFLEIRLFTKSLKPAPWLQNVLSWISECGATTGDIFPSESMEDYMHTQHKIHALYITCRDDLRTSKQRRSTTIFLSGHDKRPTGVTNSEDSLDAEYSARLEFLTSLPNDPIAIMLELCVAVCGLIVTSDYITLGPVLWRRCLDPEDPRMLNPACFLLMHCAEKAPEHFMPSVINDLYSSSEETKREALIRLSTFFSRRFQLLSQPYIPDKAHRRPFKPSRTVMSFVATDIGSNSHVHEEDSSAHSRRGLPSDLKQKLSDIGWADDEQPMDRQRQMEWTPISLLSNAQLDSLLKEKDVQDTTVTASNSSQTDLLRRSSSTGSHLQSMKRRPVFVQHLASIFAHFAALLSDSDVAVAEITRQICLDFMRTDPATICRHSMDTLSEGQENVHGSILILSQILHCCKKLPPTFSYYLFNHLTGFLKTRAREAFLPETLEEFAEVLPMLAKVVAQVSEVSIKDFRRAKVEALLFPSGSLWFSDAAPTGPMFPRGPDIVKNPFEGISSRLVCICQIRTSQNLLLLRMLQRNPQDVNIIRKNLTTFAIPTAGNNLDARSLEITDFVPSRESQIARSRQEIGTLDIISATLSRSYLLLISQIFRCMTRHLSDRNELANLMEGVNRVLLRHCNDLSIVGHALIAYMIATTRFRRLVASSGCFNLIMPTLIKIYCEFEDHAGIQAAIEYAVGRFYAVHEDAFVFQTLDVLSQIIRQPKSNDIWIAGSIFRLMTTLQSRYYRAMDMVGIHDANEAQEKETALAITVEERPQVFLASLRKDGRASKERPPSPIPVQSFEGKRFHLENLIRMLLTVIAHDPTIQRAEHFMRLLKLMAPHLCRTSSSVRALLQEGVGALGTVLLAKLSGKTKGSDISITRAIDTASIEDLISENNGPQQASSKSFSAIHAQLLREEYLQVISAFILAGGQLGSGIWTKTFELLRTMLKEPRMTTQVIETFLVDMCDALLSKGEMKIAHLFLRELAPVFNAYGTALNWAAVLDSLVNHCSNNAYANDPLFSRIIATQLCVSGLDLCEVAASQNMLFSLPFRPSVVSLLVASMSLVGVDIITELERRLPTPGFLAGVILPFVLALKTTTQLASGSQRIDTVRRDAQARAWIRMMAYTLAVFERRRIPPVSRKTDGPKVLERSKPVEKVSLDIPADSISTVVVALQVTKIIIARGEEDLHSQLSSIWNRIGIALRTLLAEGDARFALVPDVLKARSPHVEAQGSRSSFGHRRSSSSISETHMSPANADQTLGLRVVDYMTWSLSEFLCQRRNPMSLHLNMFMREKVVRVEQELNAHQTSGESRSHDRRYSASTFSKPRLRISSSFMTPQASPKLGASVSLPTGLDMNTSVDSCGRLTAFNSFPSPSSPHNIGGMKILHLGPHYRPPGFNNRNSGVETWNSNQTASWRSLARARIIRSPDLIERTCERVRVVQSSFGYELLIPMPMRSSTPATDGDLNLRAWTRRKTIGYIVEETKQLMQEFRGDFFSTEVENGFDNIEDVSFANM